MWKQIDLMAEQIDLMAEPPSSYISTKRSIPRRVRNLVDRIEGQHACYLCGYLADRALVVWDEEPDVTATEGEGFKIKDVYKMWLCSACVRSHHIAVEDPEETPTASGGGT